MDGTNTPYRTLVCYKETSIGSYGSVIDPADPLPGQAFGGTRVSALLPMGVRPENALSGTIFQVKFASRQRDHRASG